MVDIVTGGAGFIGKHLVKALQQNGRNVRVIDLPYTIRRPFIFGHKVERVYHLAALSNIIPSINHPRDYYEVNVTGTFNVLEAARSAGCKQFIYAASASCYGDNPAYPTSEHAASNPCYPYALTKHLGEQIVMHWAKVYKMPCASLRLFNVYGRGSLTKTPYGAMFNTFLAQKANGKPLTIVGDGTQQRDFVHVSDVVKAFIMAGESSQSGIYNVGAGRPVSINQIADLIRGERVYIPKRPGEPDITCADITKIKNDLKWEPTITIEQGIADMITHIDEWKDAKVWEPEGIKQETKQWFEALA